MKIIKNIFKSKEIYAGISMIVLGILMPIFLTVENFNVHLIFEQASIRQDSGLLMFSAILLVVLNSIRALPLYLGTFIIASTIERPSYKITTTAIFSLIVIMMSYQIINIIYGIKYDFAIPSILAILFVIFISTKNLNNISISKRAMVVIMALIGIQFLDIIYQLTNYGFGRGEYSINIKNLAMLLNATEIIDAFSILLMSIFIGCALLLNKIIRDADSSVEESIQKMEMAKLRSSSEMQNLVHDLKTPLTAIQALAGTIEMKQVDEKSKLYAKRISSSVDHMNNMISQIMYEDEKGIVTTENLLNYVYTQTIDQSLKDAIITENSVPEVHLCVNKIRFSRAIINLINNSESAISDAHEGEIYVRCYRENEDICIEVEDNGSGIRKKNISKVGQIGYSTKQSTGLGLNFVNQIVESHNGNMSIMSQYRIGTIVTIRIPEYIEKDQ